MTLLIPFPSRHRVGFIRRTARATVTYRADGAERFVETALAKQQRQLERIGIEPLVALRQIDELRHAILNERARLLSQRGSTACR